jgi:hypothetical protein
MHAHDGDPSFIETARMSGVSQATNGARAAHTPNKASAIPVAVRYARIVSIRFA